MFNFQKIEIVYYYFDIFLSSLVWFAVTGLNNHYGLSGYFYNTSLPDMQYYVVVCSILNINVDGNNIRINRPLAFDEYNIRIAWP
jgi:hypothetical protein